MCFCCWTPVCASKPEQPRGTSLQKSKKLQAKRPDLKITRLPLSTFSDFYPPGPLWSPLGVGLEALGGAGALSGASWGSCGVSWAPPGCFLALLPGTIGRPSSAPRHTQIVENPLLPSSDQNIRASLCRMADSGAPWAPPHNWQAQPSPQASPDCSKSPPALQ